MCESRFGNYFVQADNLMQGNDELGGMARGFLFTLPRSAFPQQTPAGCLAHLCKTTSKYSEIEFRAFVCSSDHLLVSFPPTTVAIIPSMRVERSEEYKNTRSRHLSLFTKLYISPTTINTDTYPQNHQWTGSHWQTDGAGAIWWLHCASHPGSSSMVFIYLHVTGHQTLQLHMMETCVFTCRKLWSCSPQDINWRHLWTTCGKGRERGTVHYYVSS